MSSPQFITTIDNHGQAATLMNFHNFITFPCLFAQGDSVMIGPKWRHCRTWVYPPIRSLGWSAFPPAGDRWRICCFGSGAIPVTPRGGNHQFQATMFLDYLKSKTHTSKCKTLQKEGLTLPHFQPTLGSEALPLKPLPLPLPLPYSADLESRERVLHPACCTGGQKLTPKQCCQGLFILRTIPPNVPNFPVQAPCKQVTHCPIHPTHPIHPIHGTLNGDQIP